MAETPPHGIWLWVLCGLLLVAAVVMMLYIHHGVGLPQCDSPTMSAPTTQPDNSANELMARIIQLMETQQLYLNPELKVTDVADALGVHRNVVSACINAQQGCTFNQFVNNYRLQHTKELLRQPFDIKMAIVAMESGFANERTFFRVFKAETGMTPKEWAAQQQAIS